MRESNQQGDWPEENDSRVVLLDAREVLAAGREPFPAIMSAAKSLEAGRMLWLRAPFEPVPLYPVMAGMGFAARSRRSAGDSGALYWDILFTRRDETCPPEDDADGAADACGGLVELDLREVPGAVLSQRLLAALDGLRYDDVLLVRHRGAAAVLPVLAERGFSHRAEKNEDTGGLIRVWRNR